MSTQGLAQFKLDLTKFEKEVMPNDHGAFVRTIALTLLRKIMMKTPVDTGTARMSWLVTNGTPTDELGPKLTAHIPAGINETGVAEQAIQKGAVIIGQAKPMDEVIFIQNNQPYITSLEDGHSQGQAPQGMVELSLEELKDEVQNALR